MKSIPLCIHYCKQMKKKIGHTQVDLKKKENCFFMRMYKPTYRY